MVEAAATDVYNNNNNNNNYYYYYYYYYIKHNLINLEYRTGMRPVEART